MHSKIKKIFHKMSKRSKLMVIIFNFTYFHLKKDENITGFCLFLNVLQLNCITCTRENQTEEK
jgi:hypothetical protein